MKGYAETHVFTERCRNILSLATECVAVVIDDDADPVRCHELARAVRVALNDIGEELVVVDGSYGMVDHSWITFGAHDNYERHTILDVYVPGSAPMVQLASYEPLLPTINHYKQGMCRVDIDEERVAWLASEMRVRFGPSHSTPLNYRVTEAIILAEHLPRGSPEAMAAFRCVSLIEEQIARLKPTADVEGEIARLGAVAAAMSAGDHERAIALGDTYAMDGLMDDAKRRLAKMVEQAKVRQ